MGKLRIAVATNERNGLNDVVSNVFGRTQTFTIITVENKNITGAKIVEKDSGW